MTNEKEHTVPLQFIFTADGFWPDGQGQPLTGDDRVLLERFEGDRVQALYQMGLEKRPETVSPSGGFLWLLADCFFKCLTAQADLELLRERAQPELTEEAAERLLQAVPYALGTEHITRSWIEARFLELAGLFAREIAAYSGTVAMYLTERCQHLRVPERVFFHLVERREEGFPFAFLATYSTQGEDGTVRHMPLLYALTEYQGQRDKLLALLACLNRAAEVSGLIAGFVESGELFHPLRLTAEEAYAFLTRVEAIEEAGILCRVPNWWKKRTAAVSLSLKLGEDRPSILGFDALISVQPRLEVDGVPLTREEVEQLLAQTEGLAMLKGKWVEVDHARLRELLARFEQAPDRVTLLEALRMGLAPDQQTAGPDRQVTNGAWLASLMQSLRQPRTMEHATPPASFRAVLRPYQTDGYTWLTRMDTLGFGACLADDMGLGKTVQVLAYLEQLRKTRERPRALLIVPASLLGNWQNELEKFAPEMDVLLLHGRTSTALEKQFQETSAFLTITTYGMAARMKCLQETRWDCVVLDEAQAIKNPATRQTREIKKLPARMRVAMTGTPVENDLTNLWSLFDFLNCGLLGTGKEFRSFCGRLPEHPENYGKLKAMVSPFLLRRVKTDRSILADLPEKLEMVDYAGLSKRQVVLYRQVVAEMEEKLLDSEGMERRGLILSVILRLKQICNHPDQYLGQDTFAPGDSGKLELLQELCETIREKRERVLVFTQFREMTGPLSRFLKGVFHSDGLVLHGGTPVSARGKIVDTFQGERYVPFLVLSVKAGGTGLNLTRANHVIHFDRWWNPAVEDQATDRAFRIGQTKDVVVHKLVCRGTVEERIDAMIQSKRELAGRVIGTGGEKWITELGDRELMELLRLA